MRPKELLSSIVYIIMLHGASVAAIVPLVQGGLEILVEVSVEMLSRIKIFAKCFY